MTALSPEDRVRLAKLLALLSSPHAGERDAAGLAADRLVKARGLSWEQALAPVPASFQLPVRPDWAMERRTPMPSWRLIDLCLARTEALSQWEISFLTELRMVARLSQKQRRVLDEIATKTMGRAA